LVSAGLAGCVLPHHRQEGRQVAARNNGTKTASGTPYGEPSSRLLDLFSKTVVPEPYPVTNKIIIAPLTKTTIERLNELQMQRMVGNFFLAAALKRQGEQAPTDEDLAELTKIVNDAEAEYNRLFFGDQHDAVMAFFADKPQQHWDAFCVDIKAALMPALPADGKCQHCGNIVDSEQALKDTAPLT
jgi:hypothetical protein